MSEQSYSSKQYLSSDKSTEKNFSSSESSGGSVMCSSPAPPSIQCDLDELILNSIAITRTEEWRNTAGKWSPQRINPGTRAISLRGLDKTAPRQVELEVVGDRKGAAAVTKIRTMVHPFAVHDKSHVLVTVTRPDEPDIVRHYPGNGSFDFEVYRKESHTSLAARLFERFFTLHLKPAHYRVIADSCGVRNQGDPVVGGQLDVRVYPYDQYSLTLTVPPMGRQSYSRTDTSNSKGWTTTSSEEGRDGKGQYKKSLSSTLNNDGSHTITESEGMVVNGKEVTHSSVHENGGDLPTLSYKEHSTKPSTPEVTLELKKNGMAEGVSAELLNLVRTLKSVERAVGAIREMVRKWVPQVGFKFDASVSFMAGSVSMAWGWKEYSDHRAYFSWVASGQLALFKVTLAMSFGISAGPTTMKLTCSIVDAGVKVATQWEFNRPDNIVLPPTASTTGTLPLDLKGEAVLDIYVTKCAATAGARSAFTIEGGTRLTSTSGLELYASIVWTGLDAYIQTQTPGEGLEERVYHLIDSKNIWSGALPL